MTLRQLRTGFSRRLSGLYTESEIAELFIIFAEEFLGLSRIEVRAAAGNSVSGEACSRFEEAITQLISGKPYQHILGKADFYGHKFFVNEHTLIPRPETEELVEIAAKKLRTRADLSGIRVLDIGTGSGIIAIMLKLLFPHTEVTAMDISADALLIAKKNAEMHKVDIKFETADYLNCELQQQYDLIISNPPYIGREEAVSLSTQVRDFEPYTALHPLADDPLIFYRKIATDSQKHLGQKGFVLVEINQKYGKETLELFNSFSTSELIKDLSGNDRFVLAQK